jgi:hypothetical protein
MPKPWTGATTMAKHTAEGLERLRDATVEREQWRKCHGRQTGPRTPEGKRRSAQRALRHGARSESVEALKQWLASVRELVRVLHKDAPN